MTVHLWKLLNGKVEEETPTVHLLWVLMLLSGYGTEYEMEVITGVSSKTHRENVWKVAGALEEL